MTLQNLMNNHLIMTMMSHRARFMELSTKNLRRTNYETDKRTNERKGNNNLLSQKKNNDKERSIGLLYRRYDVL